MATKGVAMKYEHVARLVQETPWAILPSKLAVMTELVSFWAGGGKLTEDQVKERIGALDARPSNRQAGSVAVLPLWGIVNQRMNLMSAMSGGTSTEMFTRAFNAAVNDPGVKAIVIDTDSPGGGVYGVAELFETIYKARARKPIVAVADSLMASAAYWIGVAAEEIVVAPSAELGSIGVLAMHADMSGAYEMAGIKNTIISAGKYKTEGSEFSPLEDEAREAIQSRVNDYYDMFVASVAKARGVSVREVREGFGQGRVVGARQSVALGMADKVATLDDTVRRLGGSTSLAAIDAADVTLKSETVPGSEYLVGFRVDGEWIDPEGNPIKGVGAKLSADGSIEIGVIEADQQEQEKRRRRLRII